MAVDITTILALVFSLFALAFLFAAVSYIVAWILFRVFSWLSSQAWFSNRTKQAKRALGNWWMDNKHIFEKSWAVISEIYADIFFYGYALVVLVDRIESFSQFTKQYPQYTILQLLELDMQSDSTFYIVFLVIFTIWLFSKVWRHNRDVKEKKALRNSLESISEELRELRKTGIRGGAYVRIRNRKNPKL
jgi:hypothetical protein